MFRLYMSLMIFICFLDKSQTFSFSIPQSCECRGSRGWKKSVIDAYSSKASLPSLPSLPAHTPAYQPVEQNRKGQKLRAATAEPNANVNELKLMHRFFYFARLAPQSAARRGGAASTAAAAASNCIRLVQLHQLPRASSSTLPPPPYSQRRALLHSANHPPPPLKYPLRSLLVYGSRSLHTAHCTPACTLHCFPKLSSFYTPQSTGALYQSKSDGSTSATRNRRTVGPCRKNPPKNEIPKIFEIDESYFSLQHFDKL